MSYFIATETPAGGKLSLLKKYSAPLVKRQVTVRLIDGVFEYRISTEEVGIGDLPSPILGFLQVALQSDRVIELRFYEREICVGLDERRWWGKLLRNRLRDAADELYESILQPA